MYRKEDLIEKEGKYYDEQGNEWIPSTQRSDGSWRPAQRVKSGYVPPEERKRYRPPIIAMRERMQASLSQGQTKPAHSVPRSSPYQKFTSYNSSTETVNEPLPSSQGHSERSSSLPSSSNVSSETVCEPHHVSEKNSKLSEEDCVKEIRKLRKKLRQIDELIDKQKAGHSLDDEQQEKVDKRSSVVEELANVISIYLQHNIRCSHEELVEALERESYTGMIVLVEWLRKFRKNYFV